MTDLTKPGAPEERPPRLTRHRFDPARFLLGLVLPAVGVALVMRALGEWDVSYVVLVAAIPAALLFAGAVAAADRLLRRRRAP